MTIGSGVTLVTGAGGFAGSHLVELLLEERIPVAGWRQPGRQARPRREPPGGVQWADIDVTDTSQVARELAAIRPACVYHCAGIADVQHAWADAARALQVNVMGTHALLAGLESAGLDVPVLVTGSALVYRPSTAPLTEESPLAPSNPYGVSKLAQEMTALQGPGTRVVVTRPFNHAGPRQGPAYVTSSFARQIAEAEAGLREPVLYVGNLDARRDITDVRDTVRAYRILMERGRPRVPYNVCRGEAYRVGDLLETLLRGSRVRITVTEDPARLRPSDNPVVLGSAERLTADTGWGPGIPIEQTLSDLLDYWRSELRTGEQANG